MTHQNLAGADDAGSGGMLRLYLLALGLIAAGLGLWTVDENHQPASPYFLSDRS
jgi:hypothetical protein